MKPKCAVFSGQLGGRGHKLEPVEVDEDDNDEKPVKKPKVKREPVVESTQLAILACMSMIVPQCPFPS